MVLQRRCATYPDCSNYFSPHDDRDSTRRRYDARQSQYEAFSRRETILVCFCGYPEGSSRFRFSLSYCYRGIASEIRFLERNENSAAVDNGKNMISAIFFAFCRSAGDRRFCLLKRNWRAVSRGRWRR